MYRYTLDSAYAKYLQFYQLKEKHASFKFIQLFVFCVLYWLFGCFEDLRRLSDISAISRLRNRNRSGETGIEFWTFSPQSKSLPLLASGQLSPCVVFSVNFSSNFIRFIHAFHEICKWYVVNVDQIRANLPISEECKCLGSKLLWGDTGLKRRTKMFWTCKNFNSNCRMFRLHIYQI